MFSLFPKNTEFGPKYALATKNIVLIAKDFHTLQANLTHGNTERASIKKNESAGDDIIKDIILSLNDSFITPYDREDMYDLADKIDDIADDINHLAAHIELYGITDKNSSLEEFSKIYMEASEVLDKIIMHLFEKDVNNAEISRLLILLGMLTAKGNKLYETSVKSLFEHQKDPISIIKWQFLSIDAKSVFEKFKAAWRVVESIIMKVG